MSSQNKVTQKEMVFYKLWSERKIDPKRFVSAWEFVGEMFIKELNQWVLMSYKVPANGVAIYFENPNLIERQRVTGKSGSKYYAYRFAPNASMELIIDPDLKEFYRKIKLNEKE